MEFNPYNLNPRHAHKTQEQWRLAVDLFIVSVYAYALFTVADFESDPEGSLSRFLFAFPLFFLAYLMSGGLRRITHGKHSSNFRAIIEFGIAFAILWGAYLYLIETLFVHSDQSFRQWINVGTLGTVLALTLSYRMRRRNLRHQREARKDRGLRIGVDVDGVLGNQIAGILPRIASSHGIQLAYSDITDWQLPIGDDSDVKVEIGSAMEDPEYVLKMPVHAGAKRLMETLYENNRLFVITSRPPETKSDTETWLGENGLPFDELINLKEQAKSLFKTDVLIDDFVGNVAEYLKNSTGTAILVEQPWNRDHASLDEWSEDARLIFTNTLDSTISEVQRLMKP